MWFVLTWVFIHWSIYKYFICCLGFFCLLSFKLCIRHKYYFLIQLTLSFYVYFNLWIIWGKIINCEISKVNDIKLQIFELEKRSCNFTINLKKSTINKKNNIKKKHKHLITCKNNIKQETQRTNLKQNEE